MGSFVCLNSSGVYFVSSMHQSVSEQEPSHFLLTEILFFCVLPINSARVSIKRPTMEAKLNQLKTKILGHYRFSGRPKKHLKTDS